MSDLYHELAQVCWDGRTLDGGELQDMLVKHGVLVEMVVDKPCSEWCNCQHNDAVFPTTCYRLAVPQPPAAAQGEGNQMTDVPRAAIDAAMRAWQDDRGPLLVKSLEAALRAALPFLAAPQPPASLSQEGGMREALIEARPFVDCTAQHASFKSKRELLARIDAALAHDGGRGMEEG